MTKYKYAVSALAMSLAPSGVSWAEGAHDDAMRLADEDRFEDALAILDAEDAVHKAAFGHQFLRARLLSWSGRYSEAQAVLDDLKAEYPDNVDIDVAMGNLDFYQGKLSTSEAHYVRALSVAPEYSDAAIGLDRVRQAKAAEALASRGSWRVDAGASHSSFDVDAIEAWGEQFVAVEHRRNDVSYSVGVNRYERFGAEDTQVQVAVTNLQAESVDWGLVAAVTPDADFRPETSLGGHIGKTLEVTEDVAANVAVHYRHDSYEDKSVQSVQPEVTTYFKSGLVLKGRAFVTKEENQDAQLGWLVEARHPIGERASFRFGFADAPEVINGTTVSTQSLFGGISFDVADSLTFHLNAARADRENLHVRNDVSIGVTRKF